MTPKLTLLALLLLAAPLSGCLSDGATQATSCQAPAESGPAAPAVRKATPPAPGPDARYVAQGFDGTHWPDLHGATVTILDHGAFDYVFGPAKEKFDALTNGSLQHIAAQDAGDALNRAIREKDAPSFDVVYGIDNAYLGKALYAGALKPYTPLLASRVNASHVFFDGARPWPATPADHGYIAVNTDPRHVTGVADLGGVCEHAADFVTQDPRTSSPGLGFLLATIASYPEGADYDWKDYWRALFDAGVTVRSDWGTAYAGDFTGGYGQSEAGFTGDKPIVTSYTTSPAYELFYGGAGLNGVVTAPRATFHQVETVAIAANARHLAGAQAFVEFVLTDAFQDLHAANNAVYPVVDGIDVAKVYGGKDPAPGSFQPAALDYVTLAGNAEGWVNEWTDLYEAHQA